MKVSSAQRVALGELKNLAGFLMTEMTSERQALVGALALRMKAVITREGPLYVATDADIADMLETARAIESVMQANRGAKA